MRLALGAALLALAAATAVWARPTAPPDPQQQAVADGCERNDTTLHTRESPNWVRVNDRDYPAQGPPPPLRVVTGTVRRDPFGVHVSDGDNPISHVGYDLNFDVAVDAAYTDLVAPTNERGSLHIEREAQAIPFFAWPQPRDRVWLKGYWSWDCDHFLPAGEETELHPLTAIWVARPRSVRTGAAAAEGDLFLTTEKTEAGRQADCAHTTKHNRTAFKACFAAEPADVDMSGDYAFSLHAPRRPSPRSRLVVRVVDRGSIAAPPTRLRRRGASVDLSFSVPSDRARHVVAKEVLLSWTQAPRNEHLRVSVARVLIRRAMDPGCPPMPVGCGSVETTRDDQLTLGPEGEWNFYWSVAGVWSLWKPLVFHADDGQVLRPRVTTDIWVPRGRPFTVLVWPRECDYGTFALGGDAPLYPCPKQPEFGNRQGDDVPGGTRFSFRSPARALGRHTANARLPGSTCPPANRRGCYAVTIGVRRVGERGRG